MDYGAIILCGGHSSRMGQDKASLPFGEEVLLQRVVRIVGEVVPRERIVCVAASGQKLPALFEQKLLDKVQIAHDRQPERGPLEGLAVGLGKLGKAAAVFVTSCDVPLLKPEFIRAMFEMLGTHEIAVPRDGQFHHPLAAVYRTSVLPKVETLLARERRRPFFLFQECETLEVDVEQLRAVDPDLHSLINCNCPEDYRAALELAGVGSKDVL